MTLVRFPAIISALDAVAKMLDSQQDRGTLSTKNPLGLTVNQQLCVARAYVHIIAAMRMLKLGLRDQRPPASDWPGPVQ